MESLKSQTLGPDETEVQSIDTALPHGEKKKVVDESYLQDGSFGACHKKREGDHGMMRLLSWEFQFI